MGKPKLVRVRAASGCPKSHEERLRFVGLFLSSVRPRTRPDASNRTPYINVTVRPCRDNQIQCVLLCALTCFFKIVRIIVR